MFAVEFAQDSCGCVIALFLALKHGNTLLSHDVYMRRGQARSFEFCDGGVVQRNVLRVE